MIVVADTTPLHYLILIQLDDLLPRLFGRVLIPPAVLAELQHPETPDPVRQWFAQPPAWLQVLPPTVRPDGGLDYLDPGSGKLSRWPRNSKRIKSCWTRSMRERRPPAVSYPSSAPTACYGGLRNSTWSICRPPSPGFSKRLSTSIRN
jgi:hypothetical protein